MNQQDPLTGLREDLNTGAITALTWLVSRYPECPVSQGDVFKLRSCRIEITSAQMMKRKGIDWWLALFDRHEPEKTYLLGKTGGYVEDSKAAMTAQADSNAGSQEEAWRSNPANLGPPPEPEAVPPHVVDSLPATKVSKMRHQNQKDEESKERKQRQEAERKVRDQIRHAFKDIPAVNFEVAVKRMVSSIRQAATESRGS